MAARHRGRRPQLGRVRPRREQDGWDAHAAFMDALVDDGVVVLGGPIGDGERSCSSSRRRTRREVEARFAPDPWLPAGILEIAAIERWTIWLDARKS